MYLSRKQVLPEVVDMFGMNDRVDDDDDDDDLFGISDAPEVVEEDDDDDLFGSDDDDDLFESDDSVEKVVEEPTVVETPAEAVEPEPLDDDDDDDDDIDALFA
jgi:hypothetical protein